MTVREYIGARYVPEFIGEWDSTVSYEPLSIVSYQGNSYTSRQYVPVGTAITNEAFWALTGNYNAQVEAYRQEVQQFDGRLDAIEADNWVEQKRINKNVLARNMMNARKFIFIGDSYGALSTNWIDIVVIRLGLASNQYYKKARGSYGFRGDPQFTGYTFLSLIQELENDISDKNSITDIVVLGGTNDNYPPYDNASIANAISAFCLYCGSTYPNALVHIGYCGFTTNQTWLRTQPSMIRIYEESALAKYNATCIPNMWNAFHYTGFLTDQVHPDSSGSNLIANALHEYLINGYFEPKPSYLFPNNSQNITMVPSGILSTGTVSGPDIMRQITFNNEVGLFRESEVTVNLSEAVNITLSDTWQEVFDFSSVPTYIVGNGLMSIPAVISLYSSTENKYRTYPGNLMVDGKKIKIRVFHKQDTGTSDMTIACTQFKINPFYYHVPAICN